MDITFIDRKFERLANDDRKLVKEFGQLRARKIRARLVQLRDAETLEDVRHLPGNYHELSGNRKGQWACELDQPYRLVFTPRENPIPTNAHGQYVWMEITGVEIIEVVDYHKGTSINPTQWPTKSFQDFYWRKPSRYGVISQSLSYGYALSKCLVSLGFPLVLSYFGG